MQDDTATNPYGDQTSPQSSDRLRSLTVLGKIHLPIGPRLDGGPGTEDQNEALSESNGGNTFTSEGTADAMTIEFARDMSGSKGYDDNLDMDQQSQEYWDNI